MATRIYVVSSRQHDPATGPAVRRLVRSTHPTHVLRHVAEDLFDVQVASQDDLVQLIGNGATVELPGGEQQEIPDGN